MWFETEGDICSPLDKKIERSELDYQRACNEIQQLKCGANTTDYYITPTLENVMSTSNLPRIERICQNAKRAYFDALNQEGPADRFDNVLRIYCTANVYIEAIRKRNKLWIRLKSARTEKKRSTQRLKDLLKLKAK